MPFCASRAAGELIPWAARRRSNALALGLLALASIFCEVAPAQNAPEGPALKASGKAGPAKPTAAAAKKKGAPGPVTAKVVQPVEANRPLLLHVTEAGEVRIREDVARPRAVAFAPDGRWLVADRGANRIIVHGVDGEEKSIAVVSPDDADFLPNGGYLVTSARAKTVLELNAAGETVWRYDQLTAPMDADRLANGNTLIADSRPGRIVEVDAEKKIVWKHTDDIAFPWDADIAPDGNVIVADYNRHHVTCVRRDGSTCWRVNHIGHPSAVEVLADGSLLVATHKSGWLLAFDAQRNGIGHWRLGDELNDFAVGKSGELLAAYMLRPTDEAESAAAKRRVARARKAQRELGRIAQSPPSPAVKAGVTVVEGVETAKKNVVLVLFDSLRHDHVPWSGYWRDTAPRLDGLARRGLIFDQYITQAPWTKPSVASLLTSTYPSTHGATSQKPQSQLPMSLSTIAETLWANGYYTVALMENPHMGDRSSSKGFEQGYEVYHYVGGAGTAAERPASTISQAIEALSKRPADQPFFLTIFLMNPHYPYAPHRERFGDKTAGPSNAGPLNGYDAEIWEADEQIGRLLDYLESSGQTDRTIFVFTSDHGEEMGDHGKRFHGDTLHDCVTRVPMVMAGLDRIGRFPGLVREIDVVPTLLDYLGIEVEKPLAAQMAGVSVRRFLEPGIAKTGLVAYSQSRFRDTTHLVSERSESRKVIVDVIAGKAVVFDLERDPQEYDDLATPETSALEASRLAAWESGLQIASPDAGPTEVVPEEVLEQMRAVGYLNE